jgi:hypothetical protein
MPLALAALTLVIAVLALGFALGLRTQIARISRANSSDLERLSEALIDVRHDVEELQRELGELKTAAEVAVPIPPLPKARSGGLDDLREQLRAAHRESESSPDE